MIKRRRSGARTAPDPRATRTRILDAAERLFSERGIDAVSVRAILEAAGVNVALAHYYFGCREGLITELLRTRVGPLLEEQLRRIDEADARGDASSLEDVLRAYFGPATRWMAERHPSARLFGQLHASPSPELRALGEAVVRPVLVRLGAALAPRLPPQLGPEQLFLRFLLAVIGPSQLASSWERFLESARRRIGSDVRFDPASLAEEFVAVAAAGLRAPGGANWGERR
jgi:AcrR family transcriptional regulator